MKKHKTEPFNTSTGSLPYKLSNDYMFRAVFQSRPKALEGLCRSVLHLAQKDIVTVHLQNPIELGKRIESKEYILDLAVTVNDALFLNLEMMMYQDDFWTSRSLAYTCRSYDNLNHGDHYDQVLPIVHVGFLKHDLFPKYPEFVANYQILNVKNHQIYSDKFKISVVYLNHVELATKEDITDGIDLWAKVFNATTWEEIDMLAQQNEYLQEAVSGVRKLTADERIRMQCQAREDYMYWERIKKNAHEKELKERDEVIQHQEEIIQQKDTQLAAALARIAELEAAQNTMEGTTVPYLQ